jgi:DNA-binding transcriptional MerR regulator
MAVVKESIPPTNPRDIEKIRKVLEACSQDLQIISDRKEAIKESIAELSEEHQITKKDLNAMLTLYFKNKYSEFVTEQTTFQVIYETVMANNEEEDED